VGTYTAELNALRQLGCDLVQGYYFAKPQPGFITVPAERFQL